MPGSRLSVTVLVLYLSCFAEILCSQTIAPVQVPKPKVAAPPPFITLSEAPRPTLDSEGFSQHVVQFAIKKHRQIATPERCSNIHLCTK
jgi:hypothetical protein